MDTLTHDPLRALLGSAIRVTPAEAIRAMADARARAAELPSPPPHWLHDRHQALLGRLLRGLATFGGAVLAAPTGHGKTWLGLAAQQMLSPETPAIIIGPAALRSQWQQVARSLALRLDFLSHERISRGRVALPAGALIIVDEAHRFRTRTTRRHAHLVEALAGRRVLLLTATPVVNRLDDLLTLLQLAVSDDALARDGVPSLQRLLQSGEVHPALAHLVHLPDADQPSGPQLIRRSVTSVLTPQRARLLAQLDALGLSTDRAVAALLRSMLERALASSDAACRSLLQRYMRLLAHADDAARAGRVLSRAELLRWTGGLDDQLLLWSVLPAPEAPADLILADTARLQGLLAALAGSTSDLRTLLEVIRSSDVPTVVFTAWRATARALVEELGPRAAWCTGQGSGIGLTRLPRESVLGHFRTERPVVGAPHLLITTDVAAEGLDLVRLRRVIHADLPWTPTRMAQREGRARRAGSTAAEIDVVTMRPPPVLERRLGQDARLIAKSATMQRAAAATVACAWSVDLRAHAPRRRLGHPAIAILRHDTADQRPIALCAVLNEQQQLSLMAVRPGHPPIEAPAALNALLATAREASEAVLLHDEMPASLQAAVTAELRRRLAMRRSGDWLLDPADADARLLAARLQALARRAVQLRDEAQLAALEHATRWCSRGRRRADQSLVHQLLRLDEAALATAVATADAASRFAMPMAPAPPQLQLVAAICFIPSAPAATFGPCRLPAPSSSISTARSSTASASFSTATITSSANMD